MRPPYFRAHSFDKLYYDKILTTRLAKTYYCFLLLIQKERRKDKEFDGPTWNRLL